MKKIMAFAASLLICKLLAAQAIGVAIVTPTTYQLSDSVLSITVSTFSPISSATASVNGRQTSLTSNGFNYQGTISLVGFSEDTLTLQVVATNAQNNHDTATVKFIYDRLPLLSQTAPLNYSVARPLLPVKARCANKDTCTISVYGIVGLNDTVYAGTFIDSVNTTMDLSSGEGAMVNLRFAITDRRGRTNTIFGGNVFVESSPYLTKVVETDGLILDFNYNKVLASRSGLPGIPASGYPSSIVDVQTSVADTIPVNAALSPQAYVTPFGAVFITRDVAGNNAVTDWNSGVLHSLGSASDFYALSAVGNYAAFPGGTATSGSGVVITDLSTQSTTFINNASSPFLLPNGGIIYLVYGYPSSWNVVTWQNGITQTITHDNGVNDEGQAGDGKNVLYNQYNNYVSDSNYLHLFDGVKDTLLANLGVDPFTNDIPQPYQANNNFVVFPKNDSAGIKQLWLKDTLGNYSKMTSYAIINSVPPQVRLDLLNSRGEFIYYKSTRQGTYGMITRKYLESNNQAQAICSGFLNEHPQWCKSFYRDSSWYISIGRELFRVNLNIAADKVANFEVNDKKDSVYSFSSGQFIENFKGPGQLIYAMVESLPAHGTLKLNGSPVAAQSTIARTDLGLLSYVPTAGFTGVDSFAWNGSNGINYTPSAGYIKIMVAVPVTPPQQPVLSGIRKSYCSVEGNQTVQINNLPATGSGTAVQVKLDGGNAPVAGDGSFSFNVATLDPGAHAAVVIFSNTAGADSVVDSFRVTAAVTPVFAVSVSDSLITSGSSSVTITANAVSGGGDHPEYAFAFNRMFSPILGQISTNNTLTLIPEVLNPGSNWVYVKMITSDTCYTRAESSDSIRLIRTLTGSLVDPDFPNQPIGIFPNPFDHQVTISGLQMGKTYEITMTDVNGKVIFSHTISNAWQWQSGYLNVAQGIYAIRLYDVTKNKVIGVIKLLAR